MIKKLSIANYILIDSLELEMGRGLNIVTGETGAGKSILMGALELLTGERADIKSLSRSDEKCVIEGWFFIQNNALESIFSDADIESDVDTIIRREILPSGKSRAFVNDTPVTLDVLKKIGALLIDIHGQQDTMLLATPDKQIETFDMLADTWMVKVDFQASFLAWKGADKRYKQSLEKQARENAELSYKQFIYNELEQANLVLGEQETLEKQIRLLKNAEDIKLRLQQIMELLSGENDLPSMLKMAASHLEKLAPFSDTFAQLAERTKTVWLEIKDVSDEVQTEESLVQHDPGLMEVVDARLSQFYTLQKKHRKDSESELIAFRDALSGELENFSMLEDEIENQRIQCEVLELEMLSKGHVLRALRESKTSLVSQKLLNLIADMGMSKARFEVEMNEAVPGISGLDKLVFKFSANPGLPLSELKNNASGGEFSRLMLAFKCLLAESQSMPTLIFDEIDTGISGEVAAKVGHIMKQLAIKHQVISITHSAQLAAKADTHWFVYKKQEETTTFTSVRQLNETEKLEEIAKMISGSKVSDAALEAARELISG